MIRHISSSSYLRSAPDIRVDQRDGIGSGRSADLAYRMMHICSSFLEVSVKENGVACALIVVRWEGDEKGGLARGFGCVCEAYS